VPDTSSQLEKYLDIASEAALAAGTIILDNWGKIETIEEKGRSGDLVTEIDRRAETEILKIGDRSSRWNHQLCPRLSRIRRLHRTTDRRDSKSGSHL